MALNICHSRIAFVKYENDIEFFMFGTENNEERKCIDCRCWI